MSNHGLNIDNTYLELNKEMYSIIEKKSFQDSVLVVFNKELASSLNLDPEYFYTKEGISILSGNNDSNGPLFAQSYSGHQYGHFTTLGDGRTMIIGEHVTNNKNRVDIQLKGSGKTPYSRSGDGKATLYSMLREYLISEAMNALHIPTTRSLAVVDTNESITRLKPHKGAILTRTAQSHIRVGTFEHARVTGGKSLVKELADYTINRHYSELNDKENKYQFFLREVIKRQASLLAKWQSVGFIHGVMNTDNVLLSGETIDYGPCAFMGIYKKDTVFSSIDSNGRYKYGNQPYIASWNLSRFAESILDLLDDNQEEAVKKANTELKMFETLYNSYYLEEMSLKLGITHPTEEDRELIDNLLLMMEKYQADFTNTFYNLTVNDLESLEFYHTEEFKNWFIIWTRALGYRKSDPKLRRELMQKHNPVIIPRNQIVEDALNDASIKDMRLFNELLIKVQNPFDYRVEHKKEYTTPLKDETYKTYCGT